MTKKLKILTILFVTIFLAIFLLSCTSEPKYTAEEWEEKQKTTKENVEEKKAEAEPLKETEKV